MGRFVGRASRSNDRHSLILRRALQPSVIGRTSRLRSSPPPVPQPSRIRIGAGRTNTPNTVANLTVTKREGARVRTGSYLTDGRRLYRVISQFTPRNARVFATLEDCRTLEVRPYSPDELYAMRLRPVAVPTAVVPEL